MLLDTHTWAYLLTNDVRLSKRALGAAEQADTVRLSPISFFEISQKVRLGKWPDMAPYVGDLAALAVGQGVLTAPLSPEIALLAGQLAWAHRDPFDRILAATAMTSGAVLLSSDTMFDTLEEGRIQRIW